MSQPSIGNVDTFKMESSMAYQQDGDRAARFGLSLQELESGARHRILMNWLDTHDRLTAEGMSLYPNGQ